MRAPVEYMTTSLYSTNLKLMQNLNGANSLTNVQWIKLLKTTDAQWSWGLFFSRGGGGPLRQQLGVCGPASSAVSSGPRRTGRPRLRGSVCFPAGAALLLKAEESRGLMCQHPGFPRGGVTLTLSQKKGRKRNPPPPPPPMSLLKTV